MRQKGRKTALNNNNNNNEKNWVSFLCVQVFRFQWESDGDLIFDDIMAILFLDSFFSSFFGNPTLSGTDHDVCRICHRQKQEWNKFFVCCNCCLSSFVVVVSDGAFWIWLNKSNEKKREKNERRNKFIVFHFLEFEAILCAGENKVIFGSISEVWMIVIKDEKKPNKQFVDLIWENVHGLRMWFY